MLGKGYKPENITLEKVYPAGHGFSGRLDICVTRQDGSKYLLVECKTYGKELEKEFIKTNKIEQIKKSISQELDKIANIEIDYE